MDNFFLALLLLSLLCLVIGLVRPQFFRMQSRKIAGWSFGGAAAVSFILFGITAPPTPQSAAVATTPSATSTHPAVVAAPVVMTPKEQIQQIAENAATGMTNMSNEEHLRSADVVKDPQGGWDVNVQLNGDDNLTEHLTEIGVDEQISNEFIALFTGTTTVSSVTVTVYMQLTDKYGNTSDQEVYIASLDKATASQVNWSADQSLLQLQILPGVWETDYDLFAVDPNL